MLRWSFGGCASFVLRDHGKPRKTGDSVFEENLAFFAQLFREGACGDFYFFVCSGGNPREKEQVLTFLLRIFASFGITKVKVKQRNSKFELQSGFNTSGREIKSLINNIAQCDSNGPKCISYSFVVELVVSGVPGKDVKIRIINADQSPAERYLGEKRNVRAYKCSRGGDEVTLTPLRRESNNPSGRMQMIRNAFSKYEKCKDKRGDQLVLSRLPLPYLPALYSEDSHDSLRAPGQLGSELSEEMMECKKLRSELSDFLKSSSQSSGYGSQ